MILENFPVFTPTKRPYVFGGSEEGGTETWRHPTPPQRRERLGVVKVGGGRFRRKGSGGGVRGRNHHPSQTIRLRRE